MVLPHGAGRIGIVSGVLDGAERVRRTPTHATIGHTRTRGPRGETVDQSELQREWARIKSEHTYDRDGMNNYGCFNVEACRNCNYVYNSRACINCHNSDSIIECVQCIDCRDCAFCVGLNGARFHILNKEYSEEDYYNTLRSLGVEWDVQAFDPLMEEYGMGGQ